MSTQSDAERDKTTEPEIPAVAYRLLESHKKELLEFYRSELSTHRAYLEGTTAHIKFTVGIIVSVIGLMSIASNYTSCKGEANARKDAKESIAKLEKSHKRQIADLSNKHNGDLKSSVRRRTDEFNKLAIKKQKAVETELDKAAENSIKKIRKVLNSTKTLRELNAALAAAKKLQGAWSSLEAKGQSVVTRHITSELEKNKTVVNLVKLTIKLRQQIKKVHNLFLKLRLKVTRHHL